MSESNKTISRFEHAINKFINDNYHPVDMNYRVLTKQEEIQQRNEIIEQKIKNICEILS